MKPSAALCALSLALVLAATVASAAEPSEREAVTLHVYAAVSLREALQALVPALEAAAGVRVVFNFGASSDLARQIVAANKADLFFAADEDWMDHVQRSGLLDPASRRSLLSNRLVVVGAADSALAVRAAADLVSVERLSLANPDAVPAGKYARAWLERAGQWERLRARVVPGVDARAALAAVESGAADAGIVYKTDAALSRRVRVLFEVPESEGAPISYPLAVLHERPHIEAARRAAAWLAGPEAGAVFRRYGFIVRAEPQ